jgi:hypothetical protein
MSDVNAERDQLRGELKSVNQEFWAEWNRTLGTWAFSFGPLRIQRPVTSQTIIRVYVSFNTICFIAGIILVFPGGQLANIGVALIVGSLFSFGAFVSQFWTVVTQLQQEKFDQLGVRSGLDKLKELAARRAELSRRLNELDQISPDKGSS